MGNKKKLIKVSKKIKQHLWEDLAQVDPLWSILSDKDRRYGKWTLGEFFQSGEEEVKQLMKYLKSQGIAIEFKKVLDFGCGVGRLAREFLKHCKSYYGIDISPTMVKLAKQFNKNYIKCKFLINEREDLSLFEDNFFDFIYSSIVFQHISSKHIENYIKECIRVLKPSGYLYFQLPSHISLIHRIQPRRRLYVLLRNLGFSEKFLYYNLRIAPIAMYCLPVNRVLKLLNKRAKIIDIQNKNSVLTKYLVQKY